MFKVRMLKLQTEVETYLAKLCVVFNKRIRGIKIKYNQNYCGDRHKYHGVDIIYPKGCVNHHAMEPHGVDIIFPKGGVDHHSMEPHTTDEQASVVMPDTFGSSKHCATEAQDLIETCDNAETSESRTADEHDLIETFDNDGTSKSKNNIATPHAANDQNSDLFGKGGNAKPCVLYMHGGGWCAYDKRVFRSTCKRLCSCGTVVFNCNFRLAPKFSVEDMQQDIYAIIDYISANAQRYGGDPNKIILAGDSAGAHLLSLFINKAILNKEGVANKIVGCAFFYGVYNLETALDTGFKHLNTYMSSIVPTSTANYHRRLQELSPVNYISADIPPTLICSGQIDKLNNSQSQQYAQILREQGVTVQSLIFPKEFAAAKHKFITFDTNEAAKRSFAEFGKFIETL